MDHSEATEMRAAERYVLGDLSVSEVEEFERHFFDCPQCSEELRALTIFQEHARAVFLEPEPAPLPAPASTPQSKAPWWKGFSPLSYAMAMTALVIGLFGGYAAVQSTENGASF